MGNCDIQREEGLKNTAVVMYSLAMRGQSEKTGMRFSVKCELLNEGLH